jgi:two-component system response regulator DesR
MSPNEEPLRVLIVDDLAFMRRALRLLLEQEGLAVCTEAENESAALSAIQSTDPHVVLLDLVLKTGESLALIPKLKNESPGVKVIVISGNPPHTYERRAMEAGASAIFVKGTPPSQLAELLRRIADPKHRS